MTGGFHRPVHYIYPGFPLPFTTDTETAERDNKHHDTPQHSRLANCLLLVNKRITAITHVVDI